MLTMSRYLWVLGFGVVVAACGRSSGSRSSDSAAPATTAATAVTDPCVAASDTVLAHATTDSAKAVRAARAAYSRAGGPPGLAIAVTRFHRNVDGAAVVQLRPADNYICPNVPVEVTDGAREYRVTVEGQATQIPGRP